MTEDTKSTFRLPSDLSPTSVTLPKEQLCHYITDGQLERLGTVSQTSLSQVSTVSVGVFCGSLIPAAEALLKFDEGLTPTGLLAIIMASIALAITILFMFLGKSQKNTRTNLVQEIRDRPRIPMKLDN